MNHSSLFELLCSGAGSVLFNTSGEKKGSGVEEKEGSGVEENKGSGAEETVGPGAEETVGSGGEPSGEYMNVDARAGVGSPLGELPH